MSFPLREEVFADLQTYNWFGGLNGTWESLCISLYVWGYHGLISALLTKPGIRAAATSNYAFLNLSNLKRLWLFPEYLKQGYLFHILCVSAPKKEEEKKKKTNGKS